MLALAFRKPWSTIPGSESLSSPGHFAYIASKYAALGLPETAAVEWDAAPCAASVVYYGYTKTSPMKRYGRPEEIAGAVSFFASIDASYVNSTFCTVDGGLTVA